MSQLPPRYTPSHLSSLRVHRPLIASLICRSRFTTALATSSLGPFVGHLANGKHPTSSVEVDETEAHPAPPASSARSGTPAYLLPALSRLLFGLYSSASTSTRLDASRQRTQLFSIATLLVPWGGPRRKIKILSPPATIDARLRCQTTATSWSVRIPLQSRPFSHNRGSLNDGSHRTDTLNGLQPRHAPWVRNCTPLLRLHPRSAPNRTAPAPESGA